MSKKDQKYDTGNPENAKVIKQIAEDVAKKQGKDVPDDSREFYEEFNKRIDPNKKEKK
jgi:hypothetical protein